MTKKLFVPQRFDFHRKSSSMFLVVIDEFIAVKYFQPKESIRMNRWNFLKDQIFSLCKKIFNCNDTALEGFQICISFRILPNTDKSSVIPKISTL